MKSLFSWFALSLALVPTTYAFAQWKVSAETGMRYVRTTEIGPDGATLVREDGWLPGIGARAEYAVRDWEFGLAGEIYRDDLAYDGRLQSGAHFSSDTKTTQWRARVDVAKQLTENVKLVAGVERDNWKRDIQGSGDVIGMREHYASWRLLLGARGDVLQTRAGAVDLQGLLVFARPEHLNVHFGQQVFDPVSFDTKSSVGLRMDIGFQPTGLPNLSFHADFDWMRIGRSDNAALLRGGAPVGLVAQAKHERAAFGLRAVYRF